jgi:thioredoxin-like negative regulator of GroEL
MATPNGRRGRPGRPSGGSGRAGRPGRDQRAAPGDRRAVPRDGRRRVDGGAGDERTRRGGLAGPRRWGGVARRGAGQVSPPTASESWRAAVRPTPGDERSGEAAGPTGPRWQPEEWVDEGELRDEATEAVGRSRDASGQGSRRRGAGRAPGPGKGRSQRRAGATPEQERGRAAPSPSDEARKAIAPDRLPRFEARLREAGESFKRERYEEARRMLRPLADQAPRVSAVRELYGLTLYRLGRWGPAIRELEAFRAQTGSTEQHPVLADCYRALGRYAEVEELWDELRAASPSGELVAEGRIVAAGALADQGRLDDAIRLLEAAAKPTKRPRVHHLRIAYALADLYERAGDLPRARELFTRVAASDAEFVDVESRLRALR